MNYITELLTLQNQINMNYITELLTLQNQIKILHWQTTSYSQHKALDKTYGTLSELIDSFVEEYMGEYSRIFNKEKFTIKLDNISNIDITEFAEKYITYLTSELPKTLKETDTNLLNIRDDMIGALQQLKYLLTLK